MVSGNPGETPSWQARLELGFERRGDRSVLARRRHEGPLVVQKALHPEGAGICHAIVIHPPAGIAGGDSLGISVQVSAGAHALLTTPGATRWYRTAGPWAEQRVRIEIAAGGIVEWLPQESIVFDAALAHSGLAVDLASGAGFIGWDIVCFGRRAAGEVFGRGAWRVDNRLCADGRLRWVEAGRIEGGGVGLEAAAVLGGACVSATFMAFAPHLGDESLRDLRQRCLAQIDPQGSGRPREQASVSLLPGLLVGRYLGDSVESARHQFLRFWQEARPVLAGVAATEPRIWRT
jgi:urease accessory protein